jgi:hypothetical protein
MGAPYEYCMFIGGCELWELLVFTLDRLGLIPSPALGISAEEGLGRGRLNGGRPPVAWRREVKPDTAAIIRKKQVCRAWANKPNVGQAKAKAMTKV